MHIFEIHNFILLTTINVSFVKFFYWLYINEFIIYKYRKRSNIKLEQLKLNFDSYRYIFLLPTTRVSLLKMSTHKWYKKITNYKMSI